jgi:hypothetical protein
VLEPTIHTKKRRAGCTRFREGDEETATVTAPSGRKRRERTVAAPGYALAIAIASRREGGGRVRTRAAPVVGRTAVGDQGMALQDLAEVARFSVKRLSTKFYLFDTKKSDFL